MRVLIVGTTYFPALNGQAVFMVNLAEGLAHVGHDVAVLYPEGHSRSTARRGVRLEPLGSLSLQFIHKESFLPVSMAKVRRVFESFQPDIVHIQDHYPLSVAAVNEARRSGLKIIGTNHFMPANLMPHIPGSAVVEPLLERLLWGWMLRLYRRLDLVTAPSQAAVDLLKAQGLRVPILPLSCGTDLTRFHPDACADPSACRAEYGLFPGRPLFITVSRVDGEKRLDVLIRALALTGRRDIQLAIVGEGSALRTLQELARSLSLEDRVHFLGRVPNEELPRLLSCADLFAMASEAELLSIASLEAMASGLPVLLADALALPELVESGSNGHLFKAGDAHDAARSMQLLADHPARWDAMGHVSLERARRHSLDLTVERYAALYVRLMESAAALEPATEPPQSNRGAEVAHRAGHS